MHFCGFISGHAHVDLQAASGLIADPRVCQRMLKLIESLVAGGGSLDSGKTAVYFQSAGLCSTGTSSSALQGTQKELPKKTALEIMRVVYTRVRTESTTSKTFIYLCVPMRHRLSEVRSFDVAKC